MIQKAALIFVLSSIVFQVSIAQETPEDIGKQFFVIYQAKGSDSALDYLFSTNKYAVDSKDAVLSLKNELKEAAETLGTFLGYDIVVKKTAGSSMTLLIFLAKYERIPLTMKITFYKPISKWQVQNFKFDDKIDEELEQLGKSF